MLKALKKRLALFLALAMLLSSFWVTAYAVGDESSDGISDTASESLEDENADGENEVTAEALNAIQLTMEEESGKVNEAAETEEGENAAVGAEAANTEETAAADAEEAVDTAETTAAGTEEIPGTTVAAEETAVTDDAENENAIEADDEAGISNMSETAEAQNSSAEEAVASSYSSYDELLAGEYTNVDIDEGETVYFRFTPEESGYYVFASTGDDDTFGYLNDNEMNQLAEDDDSGNDYNFSITYYMEADTTYLLGAKFISTGKSGSVTLLVKKAEAEDNEAKENETSGICGFNLAWTLEDGILTITGFGSMYDYSESPWYIYQSQITGISLPEGLTTIGSYAFSDLTSLESVTIPDSVTSIGSYAFFNCLNLESVTISDSVTNIGSYAFNSCTSLKNVTIPDGVVSIGNYAFSNCTNLESMTIPDSVAYIGSGVFSYSSLTEVSVGSSVTSLSYYIFQGCSNLKSVKIPDSVISIGGSAFEDCTSLESIIIPNSVTDIGNSAFENCTSLKSVTIPDSVTRIGDYAFYGTPWQESQGDFVIVNGILLRYQGDGGSIAIPDSVTSVGNYAFRNCTSLENVTIPDSVTSIGKYAFYECTSLSSINLPENLVSIGNEAFTGTDISYMVIPDSVTSIGSAAFSYSSLANISIGSGVTALVYRTFYRCSNLKSITIPSNVTSLGEDVFSEGLESIIFDGDAPSFESNTFAGSVATAYYPANNTTWTSSVMQNYGGTLTWVALDDSKLIILTTINDHTYVLGSESTVTIRCSGELADFLNVAVDGEIVDSSNYILTEGSTVITFVTEYLETLSVGVHPVTLNYTTGSVDTVLVVLSPDEAADPVKTNPSVDKTPINTANHANGSSGNTSTHNNSAGSNTSNHQNSSVNTVTCRILLVDKDGNAVSGLTLELHSTPKTAVTGEDGIAKFNSVEFGSHILYIKDKDGNNLASKSFQIVSGQSLKMDGDVVTAVKGGSFTMTVQYDNGVITLQSVEATNPETGDYSADMRWWAILALASCAGLLVLCISRKKIR